MRADVGFVHAWTLDAEIAESSWRPMHDDIVRVLLAVSRQLESHRSGESLAMLRGPEGLGHLRIGPEEIAFNGNAFLGQAGDPFVMERRARHGIIARVGSGARRTVRRCDTRGHPYDLAVCGALLVVLRHLGDGVRIGTSGTLRSGWSNAARVVREALGDGGQLVQMETGLLRWINAPPARAGRTDVSSA